MQQFQLRINQFRQSWGWKDGEACVDAAKKELQKVLPSYCNKDFNALNPANHVKDLGSLVSVYLKIYSSIQFVFDHCQASQSSQLLLLSVEESNPKDAFFDRYLEEKMQQGQSQQKAIESWVSVQQDAEKIVTGLRGL